MQVKKQGVNQFFLNGELHKAIDGVFTVTEETAKTLLSSGFEVVGKVSVKAEPVVETVAVENDVEADVEVDAEPIPTPKKKKK
jgi:hypothetical protein